MPDEIENYIHRIGRTGRSGNRGRSTTIINRFVPETVQLDLKHVLREAKQKIPAFLLSVPDPSEMLGLTDSKLNGCGYCGGPGHTALNCSKLRAANRQQTNKDTFGGRD
jgi:ATP-dependent RNA helicase DDX41